MATSKRMQSRGAWLAWLLVGLVAGPAAASPARDTLRATEALIARVAPHVPALTRAAEEAATRVVAGGELYLAGADQAFIAEAAGRAGGLMMVRHLPAADRLTAADVVLIAPVPGHAADTELCQAAQRAGALVIAFGAPPTFPADHPLPGVADPNDPPLPTPQSLRRSRSAVFSYITELWVWTGEFVAACTRRGKMPTMWQSISVPGGIARNEPLQPLKFDERFQVAPIRAGVLGRAYLKELALRLRRLRERELRRLQQAARLVRAARRDGKTVHLWIRGHLPPLIIGGPQDPAGFRLLPYELPADPGIAAGDVVVFVGYVGADPPLVAAAANAGAKAIWFAAPDPSLTDARRRGGLVIDQQWRVGDCLVPVPGYDVSILPPSAVTQLACYWALVDEAADSPR